MNRLSEVWFAITSRQTWAAELSSLSKWTVTSLNLLAAGTLSETAAWKNKKRKRNSRHLTTEAMLCCTAIVPEFWKANIKILWLPKCHNCSISAHACLHSVPQTLCLISLMYYNYVFNVDQLSQNRETNYHNYLQLFFTFSFILFPFLSSFTGDKNVVHSCAPLFFSAWMYIWQ